MRFGKSAKEAAAEPGKSGGGDWIKYLRDGSTTFRLIQEPDDWTYYWEHFPPSGLPFPCTNEEDCPGCTSEVEKMKKAGRKIAFNVLESFNGQDYVAVYKVGTTVADKLKNRYARFGTVTDRDYTVTKYKGSGDRWDFDVEGAPPIPVDLTKWEPKDIEAMLAQAYEDVWGSGQQAQANRQAVLSPTAGPMQIAAQPEEPPFEQRSAEPEHTYQEAELRKMPYEDLVSLVKREMNIEPPSGLTSSGQVVDWLMSIQPQ